MSDNQLEAINPNFIHALEHYDGDVDNKSAQSPPAVNGSEEGTAMLPCTPGYIAQRHNYPVPADGNIPPGNGTTQAAIVADVELTREANLGHIQVAAIEGEGIKIAATKGINVKVEEKVRQRHELVLTDQGVHYRRVTRVERRVYAEIVSAICIEANLEDPKQLGIEEGGDPAVNATCSEKCIDVCCQSCVCNFQNPSVSGKSP